MSAKILHLQSDNSTGTIEAGFRPLSLLAENSSGVGEGLNVLLPGFQDAEFERPVLTAGIL